MNKLITEFLGAFFLVLVIALSSDPLAIGVVLAIMVYMGGHVSGAHYNPAVTLGVWMRGGISMQEGMKYVVAQILGGCVAVAVATVLGASFIPAMGPGVEPLTAVIAEFIFTFALVLVVLHVALAKDVQGNDYYGAAIGLTVFVGAMSVGAISGGVFNPAVGLGPWVYGLLTGGAFDHIWIYLVAPLLGGAAAAGVFGYMNNK